VQKSAPAKSPKMKKKSSRAKFRPGLIFVRILRFCCIFGGDLNMIQVKLEFLKNSSSWLNLIFLIECVLVAKMFHQILQHSFFSLSIKTKLENTEIEIVKG
jgi:hypothetical protein